jgi:glycogen synthase
MSYNCVPICTPIQGVAYEIIDNNKNGFIIDDTMQKKIPIESIISIMETKATIIRIEKDFSISKIASIYSNIYKQINR